METNWNNYWFKFFANNTHKPWDWEWLSQNPIITMDIEEANPDKPCHWYALNANPNITWEIVEANPDKPWSWNGLSRKNFAKEKEMFELRVKHQKFVQEHLFEEFVKAYMHPNRIQKLLGMVYSIDELDDLL